MSWIKTAAPDEMPQGQVNKLKGMAMEAAIHELMDRVEGSEQSLGSVLEDAEEHLKDVYNVKKMFRLNDGSNEITYRRQVSETESNLKLALDKSELSSDTVTIKVPGDSKKIYLGYRKCSNCGFMYPPIFCMDCGGAVFDQRFTVLKKIAEFNEKERKFNEGDYERVGGVSGLKQSDLVRGSGSNKRDAFLQKVDVIKSCEWNEEDKFGPNDWCNCDSPNKQTHYYKDLQKCRKCGQGNYSKVRSEFSTSNWEWEKSDIGLDKAVEYLKDNSFISESSFRDKISGQRLDTWRYDGDKVEIFESKNKEKTGITYGNIAQVFYYIKGLRKAGLDTTEDARVIYNGEFPESLVKSLVYFKEEYGYTIEAVSLKEWCREKEKYVESISIGKNVDGLSYSDSGDYSIDVNLSDSFVENPEIIVSGGSEEI